MHKKFDNVAIEKKWQKRWEESGIYNVGEKQDGEESEYILVELPYPSGNLHIGHWHAFAVPDIYVRFRRMHGVQVMYPMGFDAFGLPAENAAIKRNINPKEWTESNIEYMKGQLASMGAAFSWDKTASTIDPNYYKWTQWMFAEFFNKGIAYRGKGIVNWCPGCNTVIANEQVLSDGTCERSGDVIEKREMPQWMLKITDYADRLVDDLDDLLWPESIKEAQRQWIGRSKGAEISFSLSTGETISVFTTRPDTLFGATYLVLAPEHPIVEGQKNTITNYAEVQAYVEASKQKNEQDRLDATKEKTGVKLEGITAINPATGKNIPIYVADYVIGSYGTGAIMAVPAHDERDFEFAVKFNIPIRSVLIQKTPTHSGALLESKQRPGTFLFQKREMSAPRFPGKIGLFGGGIEASETTMEALVRELQEELELTFTEEQIKSTFEYESDHPDYHIFAAHIVGVDEDALVLHEGESIVYMSFEEAAEHPDLLGGIRKYIKSQLLQKPFVTVSGILNESGEFTGLSSEEAKEKITEKVGGTMTNTYRLRDWSVGRQRYWGVPIPIVYDPEGNPHAIPAEHLPWILPEDVDFRPTGVPPLAKSEELKARTEKLFGKGWTPEVETLDTFVDSSWYFLRYIDNSNGEAFCSLEEQKNWMPIDMYFGGAEHTTMHLLYSRFWQKALFDLGYVHDNEPYKRRVNRGLVLGPDGNKMSKSKGNVIDPDDHVTTVGADSVKMYLAFMGPYAETANYPWDMGGIAGIRRFLERVNGLRDHVHGEESVDIKRALHKTIAKVRNDVPLFKFNTAISALMIYINQAEKEGISSESYRTFLKLLAPFAAHLTEELWEELGNDSSIHTEEYPQADTALLVDSEVTLAVQINGKMRGNITVSAESNQDEVLALVKGQPLFQKYLIGEVDKVIFVPRKIINIVVKS